MITEQFVVGSINVLEDGQIQLRTDRVILDNDGTEIARTFHRRVIEPDTKEIFPAGDRLTDIINVVWTPELRAEYVRKKNERQANERTRFGTIAPNSR